MKRSVPYDLGGSSSIFYHSTGIEATFQIPSGHVTDAPLHAVSSPKFSRPVVGHPVPPPPRQPDGHRLLLVEDSLIIALDAENIAVRLGAASVLPSASVDGALGRSASRKPTVAVLDINLGDRSIFAIADELHELGMPFLFATKIWRTSAVADAPPRSHRRAKGVHGREHGTGPR